MNEPWDSTRPAANHAEMKKTIARMPYPLKQGLKLFWGAIPVPLRYGAPFRRTRSFLRKSQWWTREELERYQKIQLERVLRHAGDRVPYYRELFKKSGIKPEHLKTPEILKEIPPLTREMVQANFRQLIDTQADHRRTFSITTGGTSGKQLKICTCSEHRMIEYAFVIDLWSRVGFHPDAKRAVLRGSVVYTDRYRRSWKYDPLSKELLLSIYDMTEENLRLYLDKIRHYRTEYIHCYPSAVMVLARFIARYGIRELPKLKAILTSSENTYPLQREFVEKNINARYFDLYGQTEQVALGGECEASDSYHIYPQYGYMELIDSLGNPVTENGGSGEIVGTGFINMTMPLIRYRTGDWAELEKRECTCGRNYPLLKSIRGRRNQEIIYGNAGNVISMAAVNSHSAIYDRVKEYQFFQKSPGIVLLTIVRDEGYNDRDTEEIKRELSAKMDETVEIRIRFAENIPRTARGKYIFLVQEYCPESDAGSTIPERSE